MKFKYQSFPIVPSEAFPTRKSVLRPIIDVRLLHDGAGIRTKALIDSGADWCIFPGELGEVIGLDVRAGAEQEFYGLTPGKPGLLYFHDISLEVGGIAYDLRASFTYDIGRAGVPILGQHGLFDMFKVAFNRSKKSIELKEA